MILKIKENINQEKMSVSFKHILHLYCLIYYGKKIQILDSNCYGLIQFHSLYLLKKKIY